MSDPKDRYGGSMLQLDHFSLSDLLGCASDLQAIGDGAASMEDVAERVVGYFYDHLGGPGPEERSCLLARLYKTVPFEYLEPHLQNTVGATDPARVDWSGVQCLTLLATMGQEADWCDRRRSVDHQVIPLTSAEAIDRLPMIAGMMRDLGVSVEEIVAPDPASFAEMDNRDFRVFFVPEASGAEVIPAQRDFVEPFGVKAVLGFGGVLPDGSLFSVILFSRAAIAADVAAMFTTIALTVKLAILPFVNGRLFRGEAATPPASPGVDLARSEAGVLRQLLKVRSETVRGLALDLESALAAAHTRQTDLALAEALARAMLDASLDAIVNMDHQGRITEFNGVAENIFGRSREDVIGCEVADVLVPRHMRDAHRRGLKEYLATGDGPVLGQRLELISLRADGTEFPVEIAISRADVAGPPQFTAYIADITERRAAQAAVLEGRDQLEAMVHTLQQSLLPPALPEIAGIELGAAYRPATDGSQVGGDFYDVFETAPNDWALVLGDVCGKGAEAATITALTRYVTRAAAMRARRPTAVLRQVNEALYRDATERFCTVVYGRLRFDAAKGTSIVLGSGGHPPALLLRPGVGVSEVSPPGQLLGVFPQWEGSETRLSLMSGDSLVLYSDGLTESRRGTEDLGVGGLASIVKAAEGMSAQSMADFIVGEVLTFQTAENLDDLAVLIMRCD